MLQQTERGFSLVEAIVALVILAMVFTAVWGWFGTATTSTQRIEQSLALPDVFSQFVVNLELESLQNNSSGEYQIGQYQVFWQAQIQQGSDELSYRRQPAWIVALFDIQGEVQHNGRVVTQFSTQTMQQWRDPNFFEPPVFDR